MSNKHPVFHSFMQEAFKEAKKALAKNEVPVGAVIIDQNNQIIGRGHNLTRHLNDPTAHAEILAIRNAASTIKSDRLTHCSLYVTLEPCAMCAGAIAHAGLARLYYGAQDIKGGAVDNNVCFLHHPSAHHKIEIYGQINEDYLSQFIRDFFKTLK